MSILAQFKNYLKKQNLSSVSVRNYLADVRRFLRWTKKISPKGVTPCENLNPSKGVTPNEIGLQSYRQHLIDSNTSLKTANRYLSSLRKFGQFLQESGLAEKNPAEGLESVKLPAASSQQPEKIISDFEKDLLEEKLSAATVKNYLVDTRQFLDWLENKLG